MLSLKVIGIKESSFQVILTLYTIKVAVYRGVLISGCWNRGVPLYTEVSSFQGVGIESAVYRGIISRGWNRGVPLYTEVSSFQGVGIEEFHCGVLISRGWNSSTVYRGVISTIPLYIY